MRMGACFNCVALLARFHLQLLRSNRPGRRELITDQARILFDSQVK